MTAPRAAPCWLSATSLPFVEPKPPKPIRRAICASSESSSGAGAAAAFDAGRRRAASAPRIFATTARRAAPADADRLRDRLRLREYERLRLELRLRDEYERERELEYDRRRPRPRGLGERRRRGLRLRPAPAGPAPAPAARRGVARRPAAAARRAPAARRARRRRGGLRDRRRGGDRLRDRERCLAARAALPSMALIAVRAAAFSLAVIHAGRLSTPRPRPRGGGMVVFWLRFAASRCAQPLGRAACFAKLRYRSDARRSDCYAAAINVCTRVAAASWVARVRQKMPGAQR